MSSDAANEENAVVNPENPWVGLSQFTEQLRGYFYGRDSEAQDLFRLVRRETLTVLFGQSGLGKSSLLQAGLFPLLREESFLPVYLRLQYADDSGDFAEQAKTAICQAIAHAGLTASTLPQPDQSLWQSFHRRDLEITGAVGRPVTAVLVLDQFEELFTLGRACGMDPAKAEQFFLELADLVENRVPQPLRERLESDPELIEELEFDRIKCRVLITLREDYLAELETLRDKIPSILQNRMRLTAMDGEQALRAVVGPGRDLVSAAIGEQIVRFVSRSKKRAVEMEGVSDSLARLCVEPSLLSLFCRELNHQRRLQGQSHITSELLARSSNRILQDFYEQCIADQSPAVRAFIEDELLTDSGYRENIALPSARKRLLERGVENADVVIAMLVKRRLLHVEERQQLQRVELAHDVLSEIVLRSRHERQQAEALMEAERRRSEQQEAAAEAERREQKVLEQLKLSRRRNLFLGALSLLAIGGLAIATFYYGEVVRKERELEKQKEQEKALAVEARRNASMSDVSTAALLGRSFRLGSALAYLSRAVERDPSNRAACVSLVSLLSNSSWPIPALPSIAMPEVPAWVQFSPDGNRFFVGLGNQVRIWETLSGKELSALSPADTLQKAEPSPDGRFIAALAVDGSVQVIDVETGKVHARQWPDPGSKVTTLGFGPGNQVATASADGTLRIWNFASGRLVAFEAGGAIQALSFDDGPVIAALCASADGGFEIKAWDISKESALPERTFRSAGPVLLTGFIPGSGLLGFAVAETVILQDKAGVQSHIRHATAVTSCAFSPDGELLITGTTGGENVVASIPGRSQGASGQPRELVRARWAFPVVETAFSPDAMRFLVAIGDGTTWVWDATGVRTVRDIPIDGYGPRIGREKGWILCQPMRQEGEVVAARFSPDGQFVLTAGRDHQLHLWNVLPNQLHAIQMEALPVINAAVFSPEADTLAMAAGNGMLSLWHPGEKGMELSREVRAASPIQQLAFSPDGRWIVAAAQDGGMQTFDAATLRETGRHLRLPEGDTRILQTGNGSYLFAHGRGTFHLRAFPADEKEAMETYQAGSAGAPVTSAAVSPDGRWVIAAAGPEAWLWDRQNPRSAPRRWQYDAAVTQVAILPETNTLVVATGRRVLLIDPTRGAVLKSLAHQHHVRCFLPFPGGGLVTCAGDSARLWRDGNPVGDQLAHPAEVGASALSRDGELLMTTCHDKKVRIWELSSGQLIFERPVSTEKVTAVSFNARASKLMALHGGTPCLWEFPGDLRQLPKELTQVGYVLSGYAFNGNQLQPILGNPRPWLEALRKDPAAFSDSRTLPWLRWLARLGDPDRPLSPGQTMSRAGLVRTLIARGTEESLRQALLLSPTDPAALSGLARLLAEKEPPDPRSEFFLKLATRHGKDAALQE